MNYYQLRIKEVDTMTNNDDIKILAFLCLK